MSVTASPNAAADDLIYFADATGTIHALQSEDGKLLWQYSLHDDLAKRQNNQTGDIRIDRLFARSGRKLFSLATEETGASSGHTILFALEANQLLWFKDAPSPEPNGSPIAVGDDAIYLAGKDGVLYAFARNDGRLLWQYQVSLGTIGAPSVGADGTIYVTGARRNLHAINANGIEKWVTETKPE
ncbi:MAG: PQQ-binding-like beta-propeller repeat protein [Acidobacteriota bacterium]|nr:PQQ-binding-like beta-propeller repeat protein [Acidobacteriota bacterium]